MATGRAGTCVDAVQMAAEKALFTCARESNVQEFTLDTLLPFKGVRSDDPAGYDCRNSSPATPCEWLFLSPAGDGAFLSLFEIIAFGKLRKSGNQAKLVRPRAEIGATFASKTCEIPI